MPTDEKEPKVRTYRVGKEPDVTPDPPKPTVPAVTVSPGVKRSATGWFKNYDKMQEQRVTAEKPPQDAPKFPVKRQRPNVISHSAANKGYRYEDKSADMYALLYLMDMSPYDDVELSRLTGILTQTFKSWRLGKTKNPAPSSKRIVLRVLNVTRRYYLGTKEVVIPGYFDMERTLADTLIASKLDKQKA